MGAGEKGTGSTYERMGSKFDTWPPYKLLTTSTPPWPGHHPGLGFLILRSFPKKNVFYFFPYYTVLQEKNTKYLGTL